MTNLLYCVKTQLYQFKIKIPFLNRSLFFQFCLARNTKPERYVNFLYYAKFVLTKPVGPIKKITSDRPRLDRDNFRPWRLLMYIIYMHSFFEKKRVHQKHQKNKNERKNEETTSFTSVRNWEWEKKERREKEKGGDTPNQTKTKQNT